jgi:hypothetical protein
MDELVVQIAVKHGRVAELARSRAGKLSIGRGYDNDLVLTDQHVAPRQLEFSQENGQWLMRVLDNTNPVLLNDRRVGGESTPVSSGDQVTIGRTRLSLYSTDHPVHHTRKLVLSNWLTLENTGSLLPILVLLGVCLIDLVILYFESSTDLKWEASAYEILISGLIIVLWAGIWALTGRVLRHQHHFGLQLIATAAVSLFATVIGFAAVQFSYPFHSVNVSEFLDWAVFFVVLVVLFRINLLIATNISDTLLGAISMAVLVVVVSYAFTIFGEDDVIQFQPEHANTLKPPGFQVFDGVAVEDYFAKVAEEMQTVDEKD